MNQKCIRMLFVLLILIAAVPFVQAEPIPDNIATFSIVGRDPTTGELGVAVASRFFAVGSVVPWARADIGAVATQSFANTTFGWRALDMLKAGVDIKKVRDSLIATDDNPQRRQFGIVDAAGHSVTYTGDSCLAWAGGRTGENYACQGNILTGEDVVTEMERAFLETDGTLADKLYQALLAGNVAGGDSRGKQSAAMLVVKDKAGYGGYTDQAIDIRVDDSPEPFKELGRLLDIAQMNYMWNIAWTNFTEKKYAEALPPMERAAKLAPDYAEVFYDLAVIRLANSDVDGALSAVKKAIELNPKLSQQASTDNDLADLRQNSEFEELIGK